MPPSSNSIGKSDDGVVRALRLVRDFDAALRRQRRADIVDLAGEIVAARPNLGDQWAALAQVAADNGELTLARRAIAIYVESLAGKPKALFWKALLLTNIGAWTEAREILLALPSDVPDAASYACLRGTVASVLGLTDEARELLGEAVRLRPQWGAAWLALATLVDFTREPGLADRLVAGEAAMDRASPNERSTYLYALGKAHDDRGDQARAFAAYAEGARIMRSEVAYSRTQDAGTAAASVAGYDSESIAELARRQSEPTDRTMFVMGLPRSGSTLVEQILTSHSEVADGAELNRLPLLLRDAGGPDCSAVGRFIETSGAPAAARLWKHWIAERFPGPGKVVDKTPTTTRMLGLASTLLPEAPLIWITRDPLDCAWSCFRTHFKSGSAWSYDLEDIAFHFRLEAELLERWRQILGDRLLVVRYEDLASEPGPAISQILAHCGLSEEPETFAPHRNRRPVVTASLMQVREPISPKAIGSAEPYREFLRPFADAYFG